MLKYEYKNSNEISYKQYTHKKKMIKTCMKERYSSSTDSQMYLWEDQCMPKDCLNLIKKCHNLEQLTKVTFLNIWVNIFECTAIKNQGYRNQIEFVTKTKSKKYPVIESIWIKYFLVFHLQNHHCEYRALSLKDLKIYLPLYIARLTSSIFIKNNIYWVM